MFSSRKKKRNAEFATAAEPRLSLDSSDVSIFAQEVLACVIKYQRRKYVVWQQWLSITAAFDAETIL